MDVVAGPYYYPGPNFQTGVEIYPPRTYSIGAADQAGGYTDSFILYAYDFNNDGWTDILKVNYCCAEQKPGVYLYVNPKTDSRHWDEYKVVDTNDSETTAFGDVDGDGKPELIMTVGKDPNPRRRLRKARLGQRDEALGLPRRDAEGLLWAATPGWLRRCGTATAGLTYWQAPHGLSNPPPAQKAAFWEDSTHLGSLRPWATIPLSRGADIRSSM